MKLPFNPVNLVNKLFACTLTSNVKIKQNNKKLYENINEGKHHQNIFYSA